MRHYNTMKEAAGVFKALSAPMRIRIMELLFEEEDKTMDELAKILGLTNSAISLHMNILAKAGLVDVFTVSGKRGNCKICKPRYNRLLIDLDPGKKERLYYEDKIRVGCYTDCQAYPTCGIATKERIIGEFDAPKFLMFPDHFEAEIFWFGSGYAEYHLPNHLQPGQQITELSLSFEISSECPGYKEDYPSDIHFVLNEVPLGIWISPGDYGARRGRFTPDWWPKSCNQYGLLKTLSITKEGTYIDGGYRISEITIDDLALTYHSDIIFRFAVPKETSNCGGITLFGNGFGDYDQGIILKLYYES